MNDVTCSQQQISYQLSLVIQKLTNSLGSERETLHSYTSTHTRMSSLEALNGKDGLGLQESRPRNSSKQGQCAAWCSCACHSRRILISPWLLKALLGEITVHHTSLKPTCSEMKCGRSNRGTLYLTYQFPSFLLSRYISLTMSYASVHGPQFALRMPRVTKWCHSLWKYLRIGDIVAIQELFSKGMASPFDTNYYGSNSLVYAGSCGNSEVVQFLLQQGADPDLSNAAGRTASEVLWDISFQGHFGPDGVSIIGRLLGASDFGQTRRFSILHKIVLGIISRDLESVLELSTAGINAKDLNGRTSLCWAAICDNEKAVRTLLSYGADPNVKTDLGSVPLHFVKSSGVGRALLAGGADIGAKDVRYGRSALHRGGLSKADVGVVDILLHAGINVDVRDGDQQTPLMSAIYYGHVPMAMRLLEHGADINLTNRSHGYSALHLAAEYDRTEVIPALLRRGAKMGMKAKCGKNALHIAAQYASPRTISVLLDSSMVDTELTTHDRCGRSVVDIINERRTLENDSDEMKNQLSKLVASMSMQSCDTDKTPVAIMSAEERELWPHPPGAYPLCDEC